VTPNAVRGRRSTLHGLAFKLSLWLTIIVVVIAAASGYISQRAQQGQLLRTMVLGADQLSKSMTSATWHSMLADDRGSAYQIMRTIAEKQGIDRIRMFNSEGQLTFTTDAEEERSMLAPRGDCRSCHLRRPLDRGLARGPATRTKEAALGDGVRIVTAPDGHRSLNFAATIYNEKSCSQAECHAHPANVKVLGILDVALRLDVLDQETAAIRGNVVITAVLQILLAGSTIVLLIRRFVGVPIRDLIAGTKAVANMDLDKPISIRNKSEELEDLEGSFNIMRERLRTALGELNEAANLLENRVAERTEQLKAAHQKLLHNDRLASLGELAASVAHEINNPISGVLNLSMLLERIMKEGKVPPGREEECKKYLARISQEVARVGRIVCDLLAFSRRSKPHRSTTDLNQIVKTTVSLAGHKLKLSETQVNLDLAANLPQVNCDASQIQQVVLNLVLNASEATQTREGGAISVRTRASQDGSLVELVVQDNGEGIAPENLRKIFDPFFTTKPEGKGVGLGLAVVYGIIQAHDGDIDVKSEVGKGTLFIVSLPVAAGNSAEMETPEVIPVGQRM
jgi:two-component system NtrC family sensor kinase